MHVASVVNRRRKGTVMRCVATQLNLKQGVFTLDDALPLFGLDVKNSTIGFSVKI